MSEGWPRFLVSEITLSVKRGRAPIYTDDPSEMSVLNQKCVRGGEVEWTNARLTDSQSKLPPETSIVAIGDILVNSTGKGTLGRTGFVRDVPRPTTVDSHVAVVRPDDTTVVPAFLAHWFRSMEDELVASATGTTQQTELPVAAISSLRVPVPPHDEQRRIVATLDEALGGIGELKRNRQAKIEAFDDVKASMLTELLQPNPGTAVSERWPTAPLGDLVDVLDSKRVPITKKDRKPGPIPYYGATGVLDWVEGYIFDEPLVLVGEDGAKWESGEGTAFQIGGKSWVNNHAHAIRPKRDLLLDDWLVYILVGMDLTPWTSGLTVPKLNQGNLRQIPIPLPPLDEQRRIVATLDEAALAADSGKAAATEELELADAMASSLMTDLLTAA